MSNTPTLSTGEPSTLKSWRAMCAIFFGEDSAPVRYWDSKIAEQGENQPVVADEGQVLHLMVIMAAP